MTRQRRTTPRGKRKGGGPKPSLSLSLSLYASSSLPSEGGGGGGGGGLVASFLASRWQQRGEGGRRRRWKGTSLRTLLGGESRAGGNEYILPAWLGWRLCHHYCRKRLAPKLPVRRRGRKAGSKSQFWSLGGRGRKKEKDVLVRAFKGEGGREEGTTAKSLAMQASLSLFPVLF